IYRNVFGLLKEFGDAEMVQLLAHERDLVIEHSPLPKVDGPPKSAQGRGGAAPGKLETLREDSINQEGERVKKLNGGKKLAWMTVHEAMWPGTYLDVKSFSWDPKPSGKVPADARKDFDPAPRQKRQFDQLVAFTQKLMRDSDQRRQETFWNKLDYS